MKILLPFLAVLLFATAVSAQTRIQNPSGLSFTASPDHATLTNYEADLVRVSDTSVVQTLNIGKPTPDANGVCSVPLNVQPVAFGSYVVVMRSVAGGVKGPDSQPSEVFDRAPGAPSKVTVK